MPEFVIDWTEEIYNRTVVSAGSKDEALDIFWAGDFVLVENYGNEIQDSVEVQEDIR